MNDDLTAAITRVLEAAPTKDNAEVVEKLQDRPTNNEVDQVKDILQNGLPKDPDAPIKPKPLDIAPDAPRVPIQDVQPEIAEIKVEMDEKQQDLQAYFSSPSFRRMQQTDPVGARQQMEAAHTELREIAGKQQKLNNIVHQQESAKMETMALSAIPAWQNVEVRDKELQALIAYYDRRDITPSQLRQRVLNGEAGSLYHQFKRHGVKPKPMKSKSKRTSQVKQALQILSGTH